MECFVQLKQPHFSSEIFHKVLLEHNAVFCVQEESVITGFEPPAFLNCISYNWKFGENYFNASKSGRNCKCLASTCIF